MTASDTLPPSFLDIEADIVTVQSLSRALMMMTQDRQSSEWAAVYTLAVQINRAADGLHNLMSEAVKAERGEAA